MSKPSIQQVIEIASQVFKMPHQQLSADSSNENVEVWDSLNHAVLISELEKSFNIRFTLMELVTLTSLKDLAASIDSKRNAG
jgi:acyl carrier protein